MRRDSEIPVGVQLTWALRARILGGELSPGDRLPGVRELAAATGVNVNTVRSVYDRLEADGLLQAEHGRGTFVSPAAPVDDRLAAVARRALAEAETAGLDPREVAAALFGGLTAEAAAAPAGTDSPAERRRALRAEIASLERELADERLRRALRSSAPSTARGAGGRLLGEDELRAMRDDLADRLAAARRPEPAPSAAASATVAPRTRSATRPGYVLRPSLS